MSVVSIPVQRPDELVAYRHAIPQDAVPEIFVQDAFANDDPRLWVPTGEGMWSRPLCLNASQGYWCHLSKFQRNGVVSRHRHPAPVHGFVLKGKLHYLEHDWMAEAGSYFFEPPGDVHTLVVPDDVEETITLFHNTACIIYVDPDGRQRGFSDVFTRIEQARKHYAEVGLGADYVERFIR